MIAVLLALSFGQIPTGSYGMPELCDKLRAATGVAHTVDADFRDFPVFVATRTGDPERVKQLVGDAFRAKWVKDGERYRLTPLKIDPDADYARFERDFKAATKGRPQGTALNIHDVYRMAPGETIRFGYPSSPIFRDFSKDFAKSLPASDTRWTIAIRRMGRGIFESRLHLPTGNSGAFSQAGDIEFSGLPPDVEAALKADLSKQALTPAEQKAVQKMASSPAAMGVDWSNLDKRDPVASIADHVLPKLAAAVTPDMAIALPDISLFVVGLGGQGGNSVRAILEPFSQVVDLTMADGAVIGELPLFERSAFSSQVRRPVLAKFIATEKAKGVANIETLSEYVRGQRPSASNCWTDAMLSMIAGVVIDQEYIGDYPYNMRLYTQLDKSDWILVRSGQPFLASQLSLAARRELADVLLQARSRLDVEQGDPAIWNSLDPVDISIKAELVKEDVLIGWTGVAAEVSSVRDMATNHDMRRRSMTSDPLYQPASRQKLKLTISSVASGDHVETGFTEVSPNAAVKPTTWDKLPAAIAKEFKDALEAMRKAETPAQGVPPPVRR